MSLRLTVQENVKHTKDILQQMTKKSMSDSKEHEAIHGWWEEANLHVGLHLQQLQQYDGNILQYEAQTLSNLDHATKQDQILEQQSQDEGWSLSKLSTIEGQLHQHTSIADGAMNHARSSAKDFRDKARSLENEMRSLSRQLNEFQHSEPKG